jgi:hypothetical protein
VLIAAIFAVSHNVSKADPITELVNSAKSSDKCIVIKAFKSKYADSLGFVTSDSRFIETSLYASNPADVAVLRNYRVEAFPGIIVLNPQGNLLLPVKQFRTPYEIQEYAERAYNFKDESYPLAQMDLDYQNNKLKKASMCEYVRKRTSMNLDNSEIIDKYVTLLSKNETLKKETLTLFLENNIINIPGTFYDFILQNRENIKRTLQISDRKFESLIDKSLEHGFNKACDTKNEWLLRQIINAKTQFAYTDKELTANEYMLRYFYVTYQPLKLATYANAFANALVNQSGQSSGKIGDTNACASKLITAARYIVETMSSKSLLTSALSWSRNAEQIARTDKYDIYETQAYILYKLGKREDAICSMEKAYNLIPNSNISEKEFVGLNMIKMKRGERIY